MSIIPICGWGGSSIAAVGQKLAVNSRSVDNEARIKAGWRINYNVLYGLLIGGATAIGCAKLWGSEQSGDQSWQMVEGAGFEVGHWARNSANKEKGIDTALAFTMGQDSGAIDKDTDEIILVSGDGDFAPAVESLVKEGFKVIVYAWEHAAARELKRVCSTFTGLTSHFAALTLGWP